MTASENRFIRHRHAWLTRLAGLAAMAVVLLAFGVARAGSNGPAAGGNTLTITGTGLGNGSDITNVTICGIVAVIQSQTVDSVTVVVGAGGSGIGDIMVYSASSGVTTFANGYTYNPPGYIFGPFMGWSSVSNLPAALSGLAAVSVNGKIYAIGGYNGSDQSTVYVYDPAQPTLGWLNVSNLPAARAYLATASVNGKIYAIGGSYQSSVYVYDPAQPTQGWLSVSNLPSGLSGLAAASVNGKIYAIGGYGGSYQATVYVYDPAQPTQGWLSVSNLPAPRYGLAAAGVNGKIYAIGGADGFTRSTVYVYDPSQPAQGWLTVSNLEWFEFRLAAASVNGKICAMGGYGPTWVASMYDPSQPTQGWLSVSNLPASREGLAAVSVNGKIYAIGGNNYSSYQSTVYEGSFATGVVPSSGLLAGGNTVTISGNYLGNGDVTNVTLCGISVTVVMDNSPTQVVVSAGSASAPTNGDVVVHSSSCGVTVKSNAYTYASPPPNALPATNVTLSSFYANWTSVAGATGYVLDVSTISNFSSFVSGYVNQNVGNVTTYRVNGLSAGATYYYRVRFQLNGFVSDNSAVVSVQTVIPSPPNALPATNVTLSSFFANWTSVSGTTNYLLDVSTESNFTSFVSGCVNLSLGNVTAYWVNGLNAGATYYYRLRCQQEGVFSDSSSVIIVQTSGGTSISNGPAGGGNTLTINGTGLGNGSDITNVTICGVAAVIQSQTADSVTVVLGAGGSGTGDIKVYSASSGVTRFANGYTYNPPGYIFGPFMGWSSVSNLPAARGFLAAASLNGKIYAIGGYNIINYHPFTGQSQSTVYVYDPAQPTQGWLSVSNLPAARYNLAAASMNGKIYAIGGAGDTSPYYYSTVYVYDPAQPTQGWISMNNLPAARYGLAAASVNGKIYAIGGDDGSSSQSTVYVYDPAQPMQGWLSVSNLPVALEGVAAVSVNGKIYAIGGYDAGISIQSTVYVYDPAQPAQGWLSVSNLPTALSYSAAASANGKIYVFGGWNGSNYQSSVYMYDLAQPTIGWLSVSNLLAARATAGASANGKIYALGGYDGNNYQSTVYERLSVAGVMPSSGLLAGGNTVTINGNYLGNGDVTNVTLCGISATILSDNSPTQIIVSAGSAAVATNGDVAVYSPSFGMTVKSNAYTYFPPPPNALPATNVTLNSFFANWTSVAGATSYFLDVSTASNFTSFVGCYSNLNAGNITTCWVNGLDAGTTYYYRLRCQKNGFTSDNSSTISLPTLNCAVSVSSGPAGGGNTLTITGTGLGNGSDITSVTICGVVATIQSQTANSVTVVIGRAEDGGTGDVRVYSDSRFATSIANSYTYKPPGYIFGPFTGWSSVSNLPVARDYLAAATLNGKIYAIGGRDGSNYQSQSTVYVYDPAHPTQGWLSVSNLPAGREALAAASVNGKIYAIGGSDGTNNQSTVYVYDPAQPTQGWLSVSNLPVALFGLAAASVSGKIYAISWSLNSSNQSMVYAYDPSRPTQGWLSVSNLPVALSGLAAASVNGKIYAIGGYDNSSYQSQSTVYVYDPTQPSQGWLSVSNLPVPLYSLAAASVNGKIYAISGANEIYPSFQSTVYVYDPAQPGQGWLSVNNLLTARQYLAAASVNGKIYAFGGWNGSSPQSSAYEGTFASGVVPPSGPLAGGNIVTISGNYLGNGDMTNVALCGLSTTILADNSPTQILVSASSMLIPTNGDVVAYSQSYGVTVKSNAYTYLQPPPNALAATNVTLKSFFANWTVVPGATNYLLDVSTVSNFTSCVSGYVNQGVGNVTTYWVKGLNAGVIYYYRVRYEKNGVGSESSSTVFVQIGGVISVSNGPACGGNTLTITGTGLGNGSDITNVTICGVVAVIQSQTTNSVTVLVGAGDGGTGDIRVYSANNGVTTFANYYTQKPAGYIFGPFMGWSSVSNLPAARDSLAAASLNGKIYIIGGYDSTSSTSSYYQSTVYVYDPAQPTQGWLSLSNLPAALAELAAVSVNEKIFVIGGANDASPYTYSTVYVYDPAQPTQGWLSLSNLPSARRYLAVASVNGEIYAIGGYDDGSSAQSTVYAYDPAQPTQGWLSVSNLPAALSGLAAASVNGKIYAIGGYYGSSQSKVYVYDPAQPTQGWLSVSNLPSALSYFASASVNGKIYAIGGINYFSPYYYQYQYSVYVYDPAQPTQGWLSVNSLPVARYGLAAVSVNGKIYVLGGENGTYPYTYPTVYGGSFATGIVSSSGPAAGGNAVTISGNYLGNGDVTNVALCGISANILADNSPTQIVVSARAALIPTNGDVLVYSPSYGVTVKSNAYTYQPNPIPTIQTTNGGLGVSSGKFGFNLSGPAGLVVIIEASANLLNWQPIQTNALINGQVRFTDPQAALFPKRFYRARFAFASSSQLLLQFSPAIGGFMSNQYGFNLSGRPGQTVVIEASTNLLSWTPLLTNSLLTGYYYFNDPGSTNFPQRFYRATIRP